VGEANSPSRGEAAGAQARPTARARGGKRGVGGAGWHAMRSTLPLRASGFPAGAGTNGPAVLNSTRGTRCPHPGFPGLTGALMHASPLCCLRVGRPVALAGVRLLRLTGALPGAARVLGVHWLVRLR